MRGGWFKWPAKWPGKWLSKGSRSRPACVPLPAGAASAWHGLDLSDPALWPLWPRRALQAAVALAVAVPAWLLLSSLAEADLMAAQAHEAELRQAYTAKLAQAAQVAPLQRRRQELREWLAAQQGQIEPGRGEALEAALHQSALRHGLQVELMRPEPERARAASAPVPITLRLVGRYDALGAFAADVAALEPPAALHDLQLAAARDAGLVLEATARTLAPPADADTAARKAEARP